MNKAFWSHLKHFGGLLGTIYLFLTPSKTDGRVSSSQQGAPTTWLQPDLLESFPADVIPDITGQFGCRHRAKFSRSVEKGGETGLWQIAHSNNSRRQIPSDTLNGLFWSTTFLTRTNYFFEISQPAQISGTDPLLAPVWRSYNDTDSFYLPFLVKLRHHHIKDHITVFDQSACEKSLSYCEIIAAIRVLVLAFYLHLYRHLQFSQWYDEVCSGAAHCLSRERLAVRVYS